MQLKDGRYFSVGGVKGDNFVSDTFLLSARKLRVRKLMDLPVAVKWGQLYELDQFVYYVGGVQAERGKEIPASVYRFSLQNSSWNSYDIRN